MFRRHAAVPKPSTKVSTETDIFAPDRERKDPRQQELTSCVLSVIQTTRLRCFADTPSPQPLPLNNWKPLPLEGNGKIQGSMCSICTYYLSLRYVAQTFADKPLSLRPRPQPLHKWVTSFLIRKENTQKIKSQFCMYNRSGLCGLNVSQTHGP